MSEPKPLSAASLWGLNALVWTGMGLLHSAHVFLAYPMKGTDEITPAIALESGLVNSLGWFLITPLFYQLIKRLQPGAGRWARSLLVLGVACVVAIFTHPLIHIAFDIVTHSVRGEPFEAGAHLRQIVLAGSLASLLNGVGVSAALVAARFVRQAQERALAAARLEAALGEAQLEALRLQLNPHFLFNTLNSISALVSVDPDRAEAMIARLGDLLRVTLEAGDEGEVSLAREMEVLELYLDIERVRFGDRLQVSVELGPGTEGLAVPAFILQPIVENALRHGVAAKAGPARLALASRVSDGNLELSVKDDGPGLRGRDPDQIALGVGLGNARQRLRALYGDAGGLQLSELAPCGTEVRVTLPARRAA